jgi:hypothetical protein
MKEKFYFREVRGSSPQALFANQNFAVKKLTGLSIGSYITYIVLHFPNGIIHVMRTLCETWCGPLVKSVFSFQIISSYKKYQFRAWKGHI